MVLAVALQPVVAAGRGDALNSSPRISDRALIRLAWLVPLAMVALNLWRESLAIPYLPPRIGTADLSLATLEPALQGWLADAGKNPEAAQLVVVMDRKCPCTASGLAAVQAALASAPRSSAALTVVEVTSLAKDEKGQGPALLKEIPATPTLLVLSGGRLRYAGPITEDGACGSAVREVLGMDALKNANASGARNVAARGCYCRVRERAYTGSTGSSAPQLSTTPQPRVS